MCIKPNKWFNSSHVNDRNNYIVIPDQNICFQYTYGNDVSVGSTDGLKTLNAEKCMYGNETKIIYYIPINVISIDTVDFKECDPLLRITACGFLNLHVYHPSLKLMT